MPDMENFHLAQFFPDAKDHPIDMRFMAERQVP